jgi:hypothetical protein
MLALERIPMSRSEHLFPLIMDSLCRLIDDSTYDPRRLMYMLTFYRCPTNVINRLTGWLTRTAEKTGLPLALEMKGNGILLVVNFAGLRLRSA